MVEVLTVILTSIVADLIVYLICKWLDDEDQATKHKKGSAATLPFSLPMIQVLTVH